MPQLSLLNTCIMASTTHPYASTIPFAPPHDCLVDVHPFPATYLHSNYTPFISLCLRMALHRFPTTHANYSPFISSLLCIPFLPPYHCTVALHPLPSPTIMPSRLSPFSESDQYLNYSKSTDPPYDLHRFGV